MGLAKDKDFDEEKKGLHMMGVPTEHKPIDEQIDSYFNEKEKEKIVKILHSRKPKRNIAQVDTGLLKIKTWGFKNGELQHNMPCPVCLEESAKYISNDDGTYFAPCEACEARGFTLEKNRKKGFWNG